MAIFDKSVKSQKNISDFCSDCFMLILQLRATNEYGESDVLRKRIMVLLDDFERKGLTAGIEQAKIQSSKFALVAFIDDSISYSVPSTMHLTLYRTVLSLLRNRVNGVVDAF